jgi:hypothetical protein
MRADGVGRLVQLVRDGVAVQAADHQAQHLMFPRGELPDGLPP